MTDFERCYPNDWGTEDFKPGMKVRVRTVTELWEHPSCSLYSLYPKIDGVTFGKTMLRYQNMVGTVKEVMWMDREYITLNEIDPVFTPEMLDIVGLEMTV